MELALDIAGPRELGIARLLQGDAAAALPLLAPLAEHDPDDEELGIAAGEAAWAVHGAAAAIPYHRKVLARAPGRVLLRRRLGLALLSSGNPDEAASVLQQAVSGHPDDAGLLTLLGMALTASGRVTAAIAVLRRSTQLDPADAQAPLQLGLALRETGALVDALDAFAEAERRAPQELAAQLALGDALFTQSLFLDAAEVLRRAVTAHPGSALAWARLGDSERMLNRFAAAAKCYAQAQECQPNDPDLAALLGNVLARVGDEAGASRELGRCMAIHLRDTPDGRLRVGILAAPGAANTPTDFLIDRDELAAAPIFMLDQYDYPVEALTARFDVLFNAVCDPDAAGQALSMASVLAPQLRRPTLNHPWAVAATARDHMACRLAGLEGLHMPLTRRVPRLALALTHFTGDCLVRSAGQHGGATTVRARSAEEMMQAAAQAGSDDLFLTEFVEFQSPDGHYRKLRIVFVGDDIYPVHLAIGDHWLSHYFRTNMDRRLRDEEAAFLRDPGAYLGRAALAALAELPRRVGLDYFGIDGAIGRDGRLVVFECNAAMLVRHTDRPRAPDYKREPALRIQDAMTRLFRQVAWQVQP